MPSISLDSSSFYFKIVDNEEFTTVRLDTPLILACRKGNFELVKLIVDGGAYIDFSVHPRHGINTAMTTAARAGNIEIMSYLIQKGGKVNEQMKLNYKSKTTNETPLTVAVDSGNMEMVKFLISKGAFVNAEIYKENRHLTPLIIAIQKRNVEMVKFLLAHGADKSLRNAAGIAKKTICKEITELFQ